MGFVLGAPEKCAALPRGRRCCKKRRQLMRKKVVRGTFWHTITTSRARTPETRPRDSNAGGGE